MSLRRKRPVAQPPVIQKKARVAYEDCKKSEDKQGNESLSLPPALQEAHDLIRVARTLDRGWGAFARKAFAKGEIIYRARAVAASPNAFVTNPAYTFIKGIVQPADAFVQTRSGHLFPE